MKSIFKYETPEERDSIISANEGSYLVGIKNITEGNFLIFADEPLPVAPHPLTEVELLKQQIETSNQAVTELSMIIGGMF